MGTLCPSHTVSPCTITSSPSSPSSLSSLSSNSDACWDFTVGSCETDTNGLVDFNPDINDGGVCELLCYTRDGCNYFRWSKSSQECKPTLSSINTVTSSVEPGVLRLRTVSRERNQSRTSS